MGRPRNKQAGIRDLQEDPLANPLPIPASQRREGAPRAPGGKRLRWALGEPPPSHQTNLPAGQGPALSSFNTDGHKGPEPHSSPTEAPPSGWGWGWGRSRRPRDTRRDSRAERGPLLPLEMNACASVFPIFLSSTCNTITFRMATPRTMWQYCRS